MATIHGKKAGALVVAVLATTGVVVGMGSYAFYYARGLSYLSSDPKSCVNCHIMREEYDGWQKASHHAYATCNGCHVPQAFVPKYLVKLEHGYRHSKGFTLQDFHEPILIKPASEAVVEQNCIRCHETFVSGIVSHGSRDEPPACTHCHRHIGHGAVK